MQGMRPRALIAILAVQIAAGLALVGLLLGDALPFVGRPSAGGAAASGAAPVTYTHLTLPTTPYV